MGGMCLGSLLLPRLVSRRRHPLRVYALLELGIGAIGLAVLFGMPSIEQVYARYAVHGLPGILLRGAVAGVCLLPPTLLMGATLPAIARWVEAGPEGVSWLGFFYGGNIAGAVFGCLLAGFYLLRVYDMATATYVAVALNVTVAAIALAWLWRPGRVAIGRRPNRRRRRASRRSAGSWAVYLAIALSGMSALGAEVVWTRLLSLMLGATVYTFSLILAVFLIGLGIGSSLGAFLARRAASAQVALGVCQWLLTGGHRLDRRHDLGVAPVLADHPDAVAEPLVHVPARPGPLPLGGPAAGLPVGGELPAGPGGGRLARPGPRPAGRRGLRGQHDRRHRRRPGVQPGAGPRHRHGRRRAGADRPGRGGRAGGPGPPAPAGGPGGSTGRRGWRCWPRWAWPAGSPGA